MKKSFSYALIIGFIALCFIACPAPEDTAEPNTQTKITLNFSKGEIDADKYELTITGSGIEPKTFEGEVPSEDSITIKDIPCQKGVTYSYTLTLKKGETLVAESSGEITPTEETTSFDLEPKPIEAEVMLKIEKGDISGSFYKLRITPPKGKGEPIPYSGDILTEGNITFPYTPGDSYTYTLAIYTSSEEPIKTGESKGSFTPKEPREVFTLKTPESTAHDVQLSINTSEWFSDEIDEISFHLEKEGKTILTKKISNPEPEDNTLLILDSPLENNINYKVSISAEGKELVFIRGTYIFTTPIGPAKKLDKLNSKNVYRHILVKTPAKTGAYANLKWYNPIWNGKNEEKVSAFYDIEHLCGLDPTVKVGDKFNYSIEPQDKDKKPLAGGSQGTVTIAAHKYIYMVDTPDPATSMTDEYLYPYGCPLKNIKLTFKRNTSIDAQNYSLIITGKHGEKYSYDTKTLSAGATQTVTDEFPYREGPYNYSLTLLKLTGLTQLKRVAYSDGDILLEGGETEFMLKEPQPFIIGL